MFPKKLLKTEMPFSILFKNRTRGGRFLISNFYFFQELVKTNPSLCTFKQIISYITTNIVIFHIFSNTRNWKRYFFCEIMIEMVHVLYNVLYAGVRYLVIIKHINIIHFFQRIQMILLLKIPLIGIQNAGITIALDTFI